MKIILAGSTGTIGSEVLAQALLHSSITSIIILSRRPLPPSQLPLPPKAKLIILSPAEFTAYPPSVLQQLEGAEGCIWALGGLPYLYPTLEIAREVNIDYPVYAAGVFANLASTTSQKNNPNGNKPFKFWYVSGKAVERDLTKPLWVLQDARRIKGEIETKLLAIQSQAQNNQFELHLARVGSVIPKNNFPMKVLGVLTNPFYPAIGIERFAAGMVDAIARGEEVGVGREMVVVEHAVLVGLGGFE